MEVNKKIMFIQKRTSTYYQQMEDNGLGFPFAIVIPIVTALIGVGTAVYSNAQAKKRQKKAMAVQREAEQRMAVAKKRAAEKAKKEQQEALLREAAALARLQNISAKTKVQTSSISIAGMQISTPMMLAGGLLLLNVLQDKKKKRRRK